MKSLIITPSLQLQAGEKIIATVSTFGTMNTLRIYEAAEIVRSLKVVRNREWSKLFIARNAEQILSDGFATGCIDRAIVFASLLTACGFPTRIIETIHIETLQGRSNRTGHAYVELCHPDQGWITLEPTTGEVIKDPYKKDGFIHLQTMPDFWSIGINNHRDFIARFDDLSNKTKMPSLVL